MSDQLVIRAKRLRPEAKLPTKSHDTDAGWDLYATSKHYLSNTQGLVETGVVIAIPDGYFGLIRDRSGNALKGLRVSAGVLDSGYRGEVRVVVDAVGLKAYEINPGDRVAQLLVLPVPDVRFEEVEELDETPRNDKGFNSTGR